MPGAGAVVMLVGGVVVLWSTARMIAARAATAGAGRDAAPADRPGARLAAAAVVGVSLAIIAPATALPVYVGAAAVAALGTAAAIGIGGEIGAVFGAPAYALPSLRIVPPTTRGGISAEAAVAAVAGAALTAALAFGLRMLGPSDGGLVFLAAILGALFERWLDGVWKPHGSARLLPSAIAGVVGACAGAAWVILLP